MNINNIEVDVLEMQLRLDDSVEIPHVPFEFLSLADKEADILHDCKSFVIESIIRNRKNDFYKVKAKNNDDCIINNNCRKIIDRILITEEIADDISTIQKLEIIGGIKEKALMYLNEKAKRLRSANIAQLEKNIVINDSYASKYKEIKNDYFVYRRKNNKEVSILKDLLKKSEIEANAAINAALGNTKQLTALEDALNERNKTIKKQVEIISSIKSENEIMKTSHFKKTKLNKLNRECQLLRDSNKKMSEDLEEIVKDYINLKNADYQNINNYKDCLHSMAERLGISKITIAGKSIKDASDSIVTTIIDRGNFEKQMNKANNDKNKEEINNLINEIDCLNEDIFELQNENTRLYKENESIKAIKKEQGISNKIKKTKRKKRNNKLKDDSDDTLYFDPTSDTDGEEAKNKISNIDDYSNNNKNRGFYILEKIKQINRSLVKMKPNEDISNIRIKGVKISLIYKKYSELIDLLNMTVVDNKIFSTLKIHETTINLLQTELM